MPRVFTNSKSWTPSNPPIYSSTEHTSGWKKFRLLLWKNYKIQSRHLIQAFVEILIPLLFTIVLVVVRDIVKSELVDQPTIYEAFAADQPPYVVRHECNEVFYTPKNEVTDKLMEKIREDYFTEDLYNYTFTGFKDEDSLLAAYNKIGLAASLQNSTELSETNVPVLAGVIFTNEFKDDGKEFPENIKYSIRFPAQQRSQFDLISERFGIKPAWFTEIAFPLFQFLGPRSKLSLEGGLPGYGAEGFLFLQQAIDRTLIRMLLNEEDAKIVDEYDIKLQRFPYPHYIEDKYLFALQGWLPLLTMLSFVYPVLNITKSIVHEKEKKLKESMKMMGLPNYLHWTAWFVKSFLFLFISILLMTILIKAHFSDSENLAVLSGVDFTVLLFIFFAFIFQVIGFSFFISTLSSTANSGATVAGVLWFIFFVPYFFIQPRYNLLTRTVKLACCFLTNTPIALACQILCVFEGTGTGLKWSTFLQGSGPDDDFSMGDCVLMMFVNATIYFVLALYIEGVWPGEYGVPLPWNFPLKKWYWTNGIRNTPTRRLSNQKLGDQSALFETEPSGRAGIRIQNLSKIFNKNKYAVKDMDLNMYENQITALLGHNGAGKTTTMSMLTGLFPATSGTAFINGYDISTDIRSVRSSLGICPQHDVLFDEMTVEEHLKFFCLLKGYPEKLVETEITRMLKSLGLVDKRLAQAHTLSGGMKRKLSVGIALCGGSKVVLLDEPTSGMDPSARRSTWDLIQTEKKGRTVLLSTHFMEEADLLGDRIAIMAEGELQCCGSSLFLKKKYGGGYHLIIVKESGCEVENITNLLKKRIPDVEIDQNVGAELSYSLPDSKSEYFPEMFHELETRKVELGIASYGASITTMEEVFIRVGRAAERKITEAFERSHPSMTNLIGQDNDLGRQNGNGKHVHISLDHLNSINGSKTQLYKEDNFRNVGFVLILQQLHAMLVKKCIYAVRKRSLLLGQMGIPVLYLLIVLGILKTLPGLESPPPHKLELSRYETNSPTQTVVHCNQTPICSGYKDFVHGNGHSVELTNDTFIDHILEVGERDLTRLNFKYIVGYEERPTNNSYTNATTELVGFFNNQPFHTPPLAYNYLTNGILKAFTNHTVEVTNFPLPYSNLDALKQTGTLYTLGFQIGYNIGFGMSFLAASYVVFLITERESRSKHLQFVSGLKFPIFWIANYVVDAISYLIPCILIIGCLLLFQVDDFYSFDVMFYLSMLLIAYGAAVIPFMYLWSYAFTIPATGFTRMTMFNVFTGMATMLTFVIVSIPELFLADIAEMLNDIFMVFPNYALGMGIVQLASNFHINNQCQTLELEYFCEAFPDNFCCKKKAFLDWRIPGIGKNIVFLGIIGLLSFILILFVESKLIMRMLCFWRTSKDFAENSDATEEALAVEDSDVTLENDRIRKTNLNQLFETDNLILRDLTKYYGNLKAVDKLNLGVQRGQTFGLLGVNGAGKTTTFKMLTGDIPVSTGDAFLYSHSIRNSIENVHSQLGYCPQFDGIIGEMTGRETLRMFARLRGIRESEIDGMINRLASSLIFTQYIDKEVQYYSGGNKRKLSTAMALVGNPPIVFLDEPTTGMDPVARRHLWNAIAQVRDSGTSIVLTSHSMEECEALCSRLAIMVNGKFRCLGSPQHLKNKFGEGYTLIAQTAPAGVDDDFTRAKQESGRRRSSSMMLRKIKSPQKWENALEGLRDYIEACFPDSILKDIHPGFVHYHLLPSENVSWGQIFEKMELAKEKFNLDAYSVGQTSLEQVFLNFTKAQIDLEGEKPKSKFRFCK